jgi:hypothetical protein
MNEALPRLTLAEVKKQYEADLSRFIRNVEGGELQPQADWDMVWVLSGPEFSMNEVGEVDITEDGHNIVTSNQTKDRVESGVSLMVKITAMRTGMSPSLVTPDDIKRFGPVMYYNGGTTDKHIENHELSRTVVVLKELDQQNTVPPENILVPEPQIDEKIRHTGHQIEYFPESELTARRKIVVVTDLYHCPRVERYLQRRFLDKAEKFIVYPVNIQRRLQREASEPEKILEYFYKR